MASSSIQVACEQALHLGELREVTWEQHAKGDASVRGRKDSSSPHSLESLLAGYNTRKDKFWNSDQGYMIPN